MKIYGDEIKPNTLHFRKHIQESGAIYGHNDVLLEGEGDIKHTVTHTTSSFFGVSTESYTYQPKLYFHISNSVWSSLTGIFREYCLPWRWKAAYLDGEDGTPLQRVLVCTSVEGGLSDRLELLFGKSLFITHLINANHYHEAFSAVKNLFVNMEHLRIPRQEGDKDTSNTPCGLRGTSKIIHPLGAWCGVQQEWSGDHLCHIHSVQGVFSLLKYYLLKTFSKEWEEVTIRINQVSENVLIKRNERTLIARTGLINQT